MEIGENSWIETQTGSFSTPVARSSRHLHPCSISKVRVVARVRPFLPREISSKNENPVSCVSLLNPESQNSADEVTVLLKDQESSRNECYKLDGLFGQEGNNVSQIFEEEVRPLIPGIFQGYNATVFAYGATGSGKTYTMQGSDKVPGLMLRAMSLILSICKSTGSTVAVSYYEVYLDNCYDLLEPKEKKIMVLNDKDDKLHLKGLAQTRVSGIPQFNEIFSAALQRRKVAHTGLNDQSSRSHAVLVITISTPSNDNVSNPVTGKLNLIDLAGNEDNRKTLNEGIRLQESAKINQSLFALSNVIYALNNKKPRIPYRESKLTRILQDSLGGTSRALMIACLNPIAYQESVHTVSLAARSRHVSNFMSSQKNASSKMKIDMEAKLLSWLESKGKTKSTQKMVPFQSPISGRTPCSVNYTRKINTCPNSTDSTSVQRQQVLNLKQRKLFKTGSHENRCKKVEELATAVKNKCVVSIHDDTSELNSPLLDISVIDEEKRTDTHHNTLTLSPPVSEKIEAFQSPQREALAYINTNIKKPQVSPLDSKTPKPKSITHDGENSFQEFGTPFKKLVAQSSQLKSSLIQDYVEFLNTASREELLELKGIGSKIAEYIIELRESSPLKSLNDLQKMGFSSKQVHYLFERAARGMLEESAFDNI
ncbi:kinesin-like protein KIN-10B isoform X2 [Henckelia pumila]|uniref:kinesin-like protein KIN-10B isoform X2 n=1 Tax=Henckelia pumila TaxID=405737 RepID=UPI003C6E07A6